MLVDAVRKQLSMNAAFVHQLSPRSVREIVMLIANTRTHIMFVSIMESFFVTDIHTQYINNASITTDIIVQLSNMLFGQPFSLAHAS